MIGTKATTGMDRMSKAAGVSTPLTAGAVQDKHAATKPRISPNARPPEAVSVVRVASIAKNSASAISASRTALGDGATIELRLFTVTNICQITRSNKIPQYRLKNCVSRRPTIRIEAAVFVERSLRRNSLRRTLRFQGMRLPKGG